MCRLELRQIAEEKKRGKELKFCFVIGVYFNFIFFSPLFFSRLPTRISGFGAAAMSSVQWQEERLG